MTSEDDLIDWSRVWELRDEIGESEFGEVVELFLSETETMVDALTEAGPDQMEEEFHALKGASLNLGFNKLATLCASGEKLAAARRGAEVSITPVLSCFFTSRQMFTNGLAEKE